MNLKKLAASVGFALILSGCAATTVTSGLTPAQQAQALANTETQQFQQCVVYNASQPLIAQKIKTLPLAAATTLYDASVQATGYCGTVFQNSASQATALAKALTTIAAEAGINYATPLGAAK